METQKKSFAQPLKFLLFSVSAGIIQVGSFALLEIFIRDYWIPYLISLTLSILWNFTLNRRFTFKSAANVPVAMAKVLGFYLVFTPLSTWLGDLAEEIVVNDFIILVVTMLANFLLEFLFCKLVVYRGKENTISEKNDDAEQSFEK
jgi:putative flippase GtrA